MTRSSDAQLEKRYAEAAKGLHAGLSTATVKKHLVDMYQVSGRQAQRYIQKAFDTEFDAPGASVNLFYALCSAAERMDFQADEALAKGELKAYALLTKNAADIRFKLYSYQQKADQHQDKLALKIGETF